MNETQNQLLPLINSLESPLAFVGARQSLASGTLEAALVPCRARWLQIRVSRIAGGALAFRPFALQKCLGSADLQREVASESLVSGDSPPRRGEPEPLSGDVCCAQVFSFRLCSSD